MLIDSETIITVRIAFKQRKNEPDQKFTTNENTIKTFQTALKYIDMQKKISN
jgi:hypothetical protein